MTGKLDRLIPWQHAQRLANEVKGPCTFLLIEDGNHVANNRSLSLALAERGLAGGAANLSTRKPPRHRVHPLDAGLA